MSDVGECQFLTLLSRRRKEKEYGDWYATKSSCVVVDVTTSAEYSASCQQLQLN
jgi:hypothetical protein